VAVVAPMPTGQRDDCYQRGNGVARDAPDRGANVLAEMVETHVEVRPERVSLHSSATVLLRADACGFMRPL
jgi:hypothetical protein